MAIGVDRLDYTKGILERLQAVERMLELHPSMAGRFSMVQIAAPSRTSLEEYQNLEARVRLLAQRINARFGASGINPIILKIEHYESDQVMRFYRAADICLTVPLRDGLNLVAKEYVAAKNGQPGALVLSEFAGCAVELPDALYANPYGHRDLDRVIDQALAMSDEESSKRMGRMRETVARYDIVYWINHLFDAFASIGFKGGKKASPLRAAA